MIRDAAELEAAYGRDTMPRGVLEAQRRALRAVHALHRQPALRADRLAPVFAVVENPFPWMSEAMDLKKEKNFFETRVIEYQNGGAPSWD